MPDQFAAYPFDQSLLVRLVLVKPGDKAIVANRYLAPDPFEITVDHMIQGDQYTDPKIVTSDGRTYPLSVCFAAV